MPKQLAVTSVDQTLDYLNISIYLEHHPVKSNLASDFTVFLQSDSSLYFMKKDNLDDNACRRTTATNQRTQMVSWTRHSADRTRSKGAD